MGRRNNKSHSKARTKAPQAKKANGHTNGNNGQANDKGGGGGGAFGLPSLSVTLALVIAVIAMLIVRYHQPSSSSNSADPLAPRQNGSSKSDPPATIEAQQQQGEDANLSNKQTATPEDDGNVDVDAIKRMVQEQEMQQQQPPKESPMPSAPPVSPTSQHESTTTLESSTANEQVEKKHRISIASHHTVLPNADKVTEEQARQLLNYLRFDDGYAVCLEKENLGMDEFDVWGLKKAKMQYLLQIANLPQKWAVDLEPNWWTTATNTQQDATKEMESTCRLLSLTHEEYDGMAATVLRRVLLNDTATTFSVEPMEDPLEYRTMVCLCRLLDVALEANNYSADVVTSIRQLQRQWGLKGIELKTRVEEAPLKKLPPGWSELQEKESGFSYYFDHSTGKTTWIFPLEQRGNAPKKFTPSEQNNNNGDVKFKRSHLTCRMPTVMCPVEFVEELWNEM